MNYKAIGICIAGNFMDKSPTQEQAIAMLGLIKDVQIRYNIPMENVLLHGELKATLCPGSYDWRIGLKDAKPTTSYLLLIWQRLLARLRRRRFI